MGKTYKDRDKKGLPRVPDWARVNKYEQVFEDERKKDPKHKKQREQYDDE